MKTKEVLLLIGIITTTPFILLGAMFLFNMINPMQLTFLTSFKVQNQSGQDVWITPIGTVGARGKKARLPVYSFPLPAIPAIKTGSFHLKDDQTIKIIYDWDDINFSEIAVESENRNFFQFTVDPKPTENRYHPLKTRQFIIPKIEELESIKSDVHNAATRKGREWIEHLIILGGILSLILNWKMIAYYRKEKTNKLLAAAGIKG